MSRPPRPVTDALDGRVLAAAPAGEDWVAGTRTELAMVAASGELRWSLRWEQVEAADWDSDASRLQVREVGEYGRPRAAYDVVVDQPGRLVEMVRERVTASVVLQRRVPVTGHAGFSVIARRSPAGGPLLWMHEYDPGLDPDDEQVRALADQALAAARSEVGDSTR